MPTGQEGRTAILAVPHPLLKACPWLLVEWPSEPRGPEAQG